MTFAITIALYIHKYGFIRIVENPLRLILVFVVQVLLYSFGSILIEVKNSFLEGSILTALILSLTYLYLRKEAQSLLDL